MNKDIKALSLSELEALQKDLNKEIEKKAKVRAKVQKILDDAGMTADELFGEASKAPRAAAAATPASKGAAKPTAGAKKKKVRRKKVARKGKRATKGKVAPKYRNPANPDETWAGRGRKPQWLIEELSKGKKVEDFRISES